MNVMFETIMIGSVFLVPAAVLVLLTNCLSKKKSPFPGLLPVLLLIVAVTGMNLTLGQVYGNEKIEKLSENLDNGMTAQMYVRVDSQGEITSYAPIHIIDENGRLRDVYAFDRSAADGRENQTYADVFQSMVKGRSVSAETAVSEEVIREPDWLIVHTETGITCLRLSGFYLLIPFLGLPMTAIYLFQRLQQKKARIAAETRKMGLENLT